MLDSPFNPTPSSNLAFIENDICDSLLSQSITFNVVRRVTIKGPSLPEVFYNDVSLLLCAALHENDSFFLQLKILSSDVRHLQTLVLSICGDQPCLFDKKGLNDFLYQSILEETSKGLPYLTYESFSNPPAWSELSDLPNSTKPTISSEETLSFTTLKSIMECTGRFSFISVNRTHFVFYDNNWDTEIAVRSSSTLTDAIKFLTELYEREGKERGRSNVISDFKKLLRLTD